MYFIKQLSRIPRFRCEAYLVLELVDELLVARHDVRAVLDEATESPEPERRLAVLLNDV